MARPLRIQAPGLIYHVTSRGNAKMLIFLDDTERRKFLRLLGQTFKRQDVECYAYCLMSNHYHLVIKTLKANLSLTMQILNSAYAEWWNKRRRRVGHVLQGRFDSPVVQDGDYFLNACRYVVRNPVRAGLVAAPGEWPWSSYLATVGRRRPPAFLKSNLVLAAFHESSRAAAVGRYCAFVGAPDADSEPLPTTSVIGDDDYIDQFSDWFVSASEEVPARERTTRPTLDSLFSGAVTRAQRNAQAIEATQFGYSVPIIARYLDVDPSTIYKVVRAARVVSAVELGTRVPAMAPKPGKTPTFQI
jgi:putative transposase